MADRTEDRGPHKGEIRLWPEDDWWVVTDLDTGVTTQGVIREAALENLDEAVAHYRGELGESIDTWELGIDPEEVKKAREEFDGLPKFMQ